MYYSFSYIKIVLICVVTSVTVVTGFFTLMSISEFNIRVKKGVTLVTPVTDQKIQKTRESFI